MNIKPLVAVVMILAVRSAHAEIPAPVDKCPTDQASQTFDSKDGDIKRIPPRYVKPLNQKDAYGNDMYAPVYIVVDPKWMPDRFTIEERPRSSQLRTDFDAAVAKAKTTAVGDFEKGYQQIEEAPQRDCIRYDPRRELSTVAIGRKRAPAQPPDTSLLTFGPEEHKFLPIAATLVRIRNEKYDAALQQVVSNGNRYSLLTGYGYKIGDYFTRYPTDEEPGYLKNCSILALVRPPIGGRTWAGGMAASYPLTHGADLFIGGFWAKGDGQRTRTAHSLSAGIMVPVSLALGAH